ncbi:MAG: hypothetical protein Q7T03_03215 [Deltaproteobacteria bacterium]|nr:hypothetical protein [Deltaproteobacteria bacterium]
MKGVTISERYKEKDAYDIYSILAHYKQGAASCMEEIAPHVKNGLIREGLVSICDKFLLKDSVGPTWAAKFIAPENPNEANLTPLPPFKLAHPIQQ